MRAWYGLQSNWRLIAFFTPSKQFYLGSMLLLIGLNPDRELQKLKMSDESKWIFSTNFFIFYLYLDIRPEPPIQRTNNLFEKY